MVLGACAARDPLVSASDTAASGNWKIERQVDRITGAPLSSAILLTRVTSSPDEAFPRPASLQIGCFKGRPIVRLSFAFKVGSTRNSALGYRFDDKPGREPNARFLLDFKTVVLEEPADVAPFVADLATSKSLYVRFRSLTTGRSSAEFNVEGAPEAIKAAFADCPLLPNAAPPKRTSALQFVNLFGFG